MLQLLHVVTGYSYRAHAVCFDGARCSSYIFSYYDQNSYTRELTSNDLSEAYDTEHHYCLFIPFVSRRLGLMDS
jgi:hypothetical protein